MIESDTDLATSEVKSNFATDIQVLSDDVCLSLYEKLRLYVSNEDALINHRMNWLLVSQTLTFAAAGAMIEHGSAVFSAVRLPAWLPVSAGDILVFLIAIMGLRFAWLSLQALCAAKTAIERICHTYSDEFVKRGLPKLTGGGSSTAHEDGFVLHIGVPWVFIVAWSAVILGVLIT